MHTSDLVWQGAASGKASQRLGLCLAYVLGFCFGFWETRNDVEDLRGDNPEGFVTGRAWRWDSQGQGNIGRPHSRRFWFKLKLLLGRAWQQITCCRKLNFQVLRMQHVATGRQQIPVPVQALTSCCSNSTCWGRRVGNGGTHTISYYILDYLSMGSMGYLCSLISPSLRDVLTCFDHL